MKPHEKFWAFLKRKCWYVVLLLCSSIYVFRYKYEINQLKDFNAQNLIFILWLVLLLMPLFSEMEFFGVKFKKEVERAKSEVKESLSELRLQIMDLKISNSVSNTVFVGNPLASKEQLDEMLGGIIPSAIETKENEANTSFEKAKTDFDVSEQSTYLFKVRLILEKLLSEICEKTGYEGDKQYRHMANHLCGLGILSIESMKIILQIQGIANRGIHGEIISAEYINFVEKAFPKIQKELNGENSALRYCFCPRCKYSGYAKFENVCPKCGFVHDGD